MLSLLQVVPLPLYVMHQLPIFGDEHRLVEGLKTCINGEEQGLNLTPLLIPGCGRNKGSVRIFKTWNTCNTKC